MLYDEENVTYSPESKLLINVPLGNMSICGVADMSAKDFCLCNCDASAQTHGARTPVSMRGN